MRYSVLNDDYVNGDRKDATLSRPAAAPAPRRRSGPSLTTQFNVIFRDQGLPRLGYYTDLLYIANVVAPGSFNDIQLGNNITGFYTTAGADRVHRLLRP